MKTWMWLAGAGAVWYFFTRPRTLEEVVNAQEEIIPDEGAYEGDSFAESVNVSDY